MPIWTPLFILAQQTEASGSYLGMFVRLAVVFVICAALLLGAWYVRNRIREASSEPARDFSIGDFRQLVRDGKMTQEEFDRAKGALIAKEQAKLQSPLDKDNRGKPGPPRMEVKP